MLTLRSCEIAKPPCNTENEAAAIKQKPSENGRADFWKGIWSVFSIPKSLPSMRTIPFAMKNKYMQKSDAGARYSTSSDSLCALRTRIPKKQTTHQLNQRNY